MTLQAFLARLYVDAAFRAGFFADPSRAATSAGLSPAEALAVAAMDRNEIELAAASFEAKRNGARASPTQGRSARPGLGVGEAAPGPSRSA